MLVRKALRARDLGCGLAILFGTGRATAVEAAAPPPERVRISYTLGADCPSPDAFERALDERLGSAWKAAPDELARSVLIAETTTDGGSHVQMNYDDSAGRQISRAVDAATCAEALDVMAVITAVALDAQVQEPAPTPPSVSPAPSAGAPLSVVLPPAEQRAPGPTSPSAAPHQPFVHELGVRLGLSSGFGTRVAFGVGAEWGLVGENGLALRVALEGRDTGSVPASDGRARFRALTLRSDFCAVTLVVSRAFGVPLCAGLEIGTLWAEGVLDQPAVTFQKSSFTPWLAGVLSPRLRFVAGRAFVELVPELRIPLVRHAFLFENPSRTAFEIPPVAFGAALSAGLRFP